MNLNIRALLFWVGLIGVQTLAQGADEIRSRTTYSAAYGKTKNAVSVDPARDLPRYAPVEPKKAVSTWQVKSGFRMELAAHEPQVRDPVAICFDERGRMFVCEMIDYSEMREVNPHLGRVSMLEDRDGDGIYETSTVFANDLAWPTGLIWANGGLYVGATPDIWRLEDRDGDGKAEFREKAYTGFGTGLKILNVQGLLNSFQWGLDNKIHVLAGGGNRGVISSPKRPDLSGEELGGRDFWFDPLTHAFGFESGGAQYGMSFDDYGRKFGCSNSDHLQHWVYNAESIARSSAFGMPAARQSIAADGGAAEVFRISPDEPWRIVRTRWRVSGAVPGGVEGGGRVSGYFTGATGTTIYRGDAYGAEFVNNSFTGDAGGQLIHRKVIRPAEDGVSLLGERPLDERGFEFAASRDTWVRLVNFANAPDGCLYALDMYREVIEHPWSIPDEIKRHLDLNSGNDRGRIYRILPAEGVSRVGASVTLAQSSVSQLVATLAHPNGWHRDTAHRLLCERNDKEAIPFLRIRLRQGGLLEKLHALSVLKALGDLSLKDLEERLLDDSPEVRIGALHLLREQSQGGLLEDSVVRSLGRLAEDPNAGVRFELALTLGTMVRKDVSGACSELAVRLLKTDHAHPWIGSALLNLPPEYLLKFLFPLMVKESVLETLNDAFVGKFLAICASSASTEDRVRLLQFVARGEPRVAWVNAIGEGFRGAGSSLEKADVGGVLAPWLGRNVKRAGDRSLVVGDRLGAIEVLRHVSSKDARRVLFECVGKSQPAEVQRTAIRVVLQTGIGPEIDEVISRWLELEGGARELVKGALLSKVDGIMKMLKAVELGTISVKEFTPVELQTLIRSKDAKVAEISQRVLGAMLPPSREEVVSKYQKALELAGKAERGRTIFLQRCAACHRASGDGVEVGPDLITVKTKGREGLLSAILEPNKEVAAQYILYTINTKQDETVSGVVIEDTATGMTLKMPGGQLRTIERAQIKGSSSTGQSLMPEGLEGGMEVQDMADLITFIEELK